MGFYTAMVLKCVMSYRATVYLHAQFRKENNN